MVLPTPQDLRNAQQRYMDSNPQIKFDNTGVALPHPPRQWREDLFKPGDFEALDRHVLSAPGKLGFGSCEELVPYITSTCRSQLEKVRAVVRWISANSSAKGLLQQNRDQTCPLLRIAGHDYSGLLHDMITCAGVKCREVHGVGKDAHYDVGRPDTIQKWSWTAICIDNDWWNMSMNAVCTGVHGFKTGNWVDLEVQGQNLLRENTEDSIAVAVHGFLDESSFLPNPDAFAFWAFPDEPEWQLLARPLTKDEFENMCYCQSTFFEHGLQLGSHPGCDVTTDVGECKIMIKRPADREINFTYLLALSTDDMTDSVQDKFEEVERLVFPEGFKDEWTATVFCPVKGKYKLEIYSSSPPNDKKFSTACTYAIHCYTADPHAKPLPENKRGLWGPGQDTVNLGMEPVSHLEGRVPAKDGTTEVRMKLDPGVNITHELDDASAKGFKNFVIHTIEEDEAVSYIRAPSKGAFKLSIFADKQGDDFRTLACTYLIDASKCALFQDPFPELNRGEVGLNDQFKTGIGLKKKNHQDSYMRINQDCSLEFTTECPAELMPQLKRQTKEAPEDFDEYCSVQYTAEKEITLNCQFPKPGVYHLILFGRLLSTGNEAKFAPLANYVFEVAEVSDENRSFPKVGTMSEWCKGYRVIKPQKGKVCRDEEVEVELEAPTHVELLALLGKENIVMEKQDDGNWKGRVQAGENGVAVVTQVPDGQKLLLRFELTTQEEKQKLEDDKAKAKEELRQAEEQQRRDDKGEAEEKEELEKLCLKEDEVLETKGIKRSSVLDEERYFVRPIRQPALHQARKQEDKTIIVRYEPKGKGPTSEEAKGLQLAVADTAKKMELELHAEPELMTEVKVMPENEDPTTEETETKDVSVAQEVSVSDLDKDEPRAARPLSAQYSFADVVKGATTPRDSSPEKGSMIRPLSAASVDQRAMTPMAKNDVDGE